MSVDETGITRRVSGIATNWRLTITGRGYWVAIPLVGHGIPLAHALHLHYMRMPHVAWMDWPGIVGQVVRVDGYLGGRRPTGTVGTYHIDTVAGLRIFADYVARPGLTEAVFQSPPRGSDRETTG